MFNSRTTTTLFSMLLAIATCSTAQADHYDHVDRVALRILKKSQRLTNELNHYRHTPQYRHLVNDTLQLRDCAQHIHDVTHFKGNLNHLASDLAQLDQAFHHLEGVFDRVETAAAHGRGHVHGNTRHVKNLLNSIERDIHHLQDDVDAIRLAEARVVRVPVVTSYRTPNVASVIHEYGHTNYRSKHGHSSHRNHGHYNSRHQARGFSIGGGSSRIWIGF